MKENRMQETQENFKVAPIISDQKLQEVKYKTASTLIGLSTIGHYQYHQVTDDMKKRVQTIAIILYFLQPALIIIPSSVIAQQNLNPLAVLIPTVVCPIISILSDCFLSKNKSPHRYIFTMIYAFLWAVHFYISRQLMKGQYISVGVYAAILILSIISVITSFSTVCFSPVRQFSASTFDYQGFNFHSTLYVRFYVSLPILITQLGIYYSQSTTISHPALPTLQFIASLSFVLWIFGWVSSFYNNLIFIVQNLLNCLIFGQQLTHAGSKYRGANVWWISFLTLGLNFLAIGANIALILGMKSRGQPVLKIVQSQHVLLVCLAIFTSLFTTFTFYVSYRCSNHKRSLIRYNKFNYTQIQGHQNNENDQIKKNESKKRVYKGKCFFGHKQIMMTIATIFAAVAVCLLAAVAFYRFYDAYGLGIPYQANTNFIAQKITTWILLLIDVIAYLLYITIKQVTRTRSKFGCKINACLTDKYFLQVERDFFMKMILKVTGALAVMGLVLRIQDIQSFAWYIQRITPLSPDPNSYVHFFVVNILIPILIYRSYKRTQTFSHFFHITIIVSFVLTIINSTLYFYYSILVVLAMPNFPENPFRMLLISPFTIPQKLVHKQQARYRIGYIVVNFITLILYIATLGTLEFSMIFGLPMYWCVIPSINCQSVKDKKVQTRSNAGGISKMTISDFQATNQVIQINNHQANNSSTPEHNLYEKIVSEIPFYIFRNKTPGYYLLRIGKYILLAEVICDFYGIFEAVSLIGLETQQVTTCHAKQGETIDRIVDYTWGDNPSNQQKCACNDALKTVIHEQHCVRKLKLTGQNDIQLTGVIQSSQFYQLFKKCLIKSVIFNYNKFLQNNPRNELTANQIKQAQVLLQDLYMRMSKQKVDQIFPYSFITQKNGIIFSTKYKQLSTSKIIVRKKLPPIGKKDKNEKKQKIIDDFADLVGASVTSDIIKEVENKQQALDIDKQEGEEIGKEVQINQKRQLSELHMAIIMSAYTSVIGKINYIHQQKIYKMLRKDSSAISQFQFEGGLDLIASSVGCALKLAIAKHLQGQSDIQIEDLISYDKNQYLGTMQSGGFSQAISLQKQDIWTVSYNQTKRALAVKRLAKNQTTLYMFSLQNHAVQAVWNNLRYELLFATNDNDERYSIQTHQYLLRNLLVQGCEQPYGYAGFYSEQFLNL